MLPRTSSIWQRDSHPTASGKPGAVQYGGLGVGELRRVKQLEDENRKLKQLVADLSLDKHILQDVLAKKL